MKKCKVVLITVLLMLFILSGSAFALNKNNIKIEVNGNQITATTQIREIVSWWPRARYETKEKELWSTGFPSLGKEGKLYGPTDEINGKIYFAYSSYVMEFDTFSGQFTNRYHILGEVTGLKNEGGKLIINTFDGIRNEVWDKEKTLQVTPEQLKNYSNHTILTNRSTDLINIKIKDAEQLSEVFDKQLSISDLVKGKHPVEQLELAREEYLLIADVDLTNPWYYVYLGLISQQMGREIYSNVYFQKALEIRSLVFYDYFQLSTLFEYIGNRSLADRAYNLGMKDFLNRGYIPEQLSSIPSILTYSPWLIPAIDNLKAKDLERTIVVVERFNKLAPFKEGNYNVLNGFVKYLIDKGRLIEAREWQIKAGNSKGFLFPGDYSILLADISLNVFIASMVAFLVFLVLFTLWHIKCYLAYKKLASRENSRKLLLKRYYSKKQAFSLALLYGLTLVSISLFNNNLRVIGSVVNAPDTVNSGTWGNYATMKYFSETLNNNQSGNFFKALASYQLKDFKTAEDIFQSIDTAKAHNNLGVIYLQQKKKEEAKKEFEKALILDKYLVEAKYNLSLIDSTVKAPKREEIVDFYKEFAPYKPIVAMPGQEDYRSAYYQDYTLSGFSPYNIKWLGRFFGQMNENISRFDAANNRFLIMFLESLTALFVIFTLVVILMLAGLFIPRTNIGSVNNYYSRRFLGLFIPGLSYNWKYLGPLLFALWLGAGITNLFYFIYTVRAGEPTAGFLTTFTLPEYSLLAPLSSLDMAYSAEVGFITAAIFVILWIFNFFYVLVSKRFVTN